MTLGAKIARQIGLLAAYYRRRGFPSVQELVIEAIRRTDFLGDLDAATLERDVAASIGLAADIWEDALGLTLPLALMQDAQKMLLAHGQALLRAREQTAADDLASGIEAGDLDRDGEPIPYPRYYGGV